MIHLHLVDIRSMKPIMEWKGNKKPPCIAQFSFDENSIYSVDTSGEVNKGTFEYLHKLHIASLFFFSYLSGLYINPVNACLVAHWKDSRLFLVYQWTYQRLLRPQYHQRKVKDHSEMTVSFNYFYLDLLALKWSHLALIQTMCCALLQITMDPFIKC